MMVYVNVYMSRLIPPRVSMHLKMKVTLNEIQNVNDELKVIVGPGLTREGSQVFSSRCGILRQKTNTKVAVFWVDCHSKRYVPARGENVIGVVVGKAGDSFRVSVALNY